MEIDESDNSDKNSGSVAESKFKGKRKLYVGSQAMGYRRDHMEVRLSNILMYFWFSIV